MPSCLLQLPNLITLHLSGNGISGTLPDIPISPFLLDLSLSHNILTGTIPLRFQQREWFNFDLAFNRLMGSLSSEFESIRHNSSFFSVLSLLLNENISEASIQSSLSIENNRLSGRIPSVLVDKKNISMLGSNVFSCNLRETNLPKHDSDRSNYQCGSDTFNVPIYLWLSLMSVWACLLCVGWHYRAQVEKTMGIEYAIGHVMKWVNVLEDKVSVLGGSRLQAYRTVLELSAAVCRIALICTVYALSVLMPTYVICSYYSGALLHQYAWVLSAGFISGEAAAVVMLVLLMGTLCLLLVGFMHYTHQQNLTAMFRQQTSAISSQQNDDTSVVSKASLISESRRYTMLMICIYALFLTINLVVVVGVNTAYVVAAIYGSNSLLFFEQLILSCFKLFWNRFFSIYLIRWTARLKVFVGAGSQDEQFQGLSAQKEFVSLQIFVALLNNIGIPCLVVAMVSPSCFYNVFVAAPTVSAAYTYGSCGEVNGSECAYFLPGKISSSYTPPYIYNFQCSASIITYYAPTFVLVCLLRACVSPLMQLTLYHLHRRAYPNTRWHSILESFLLPNLKVIVPGSQARMDVFRPLFDANQLLLSLFTYTGLLLTFGVVFPPVALTLLVTLLAVYHLNKLKANRFILRAVEMEQLDYVDVIEKESAGAGFVPVLERAVWMLITASCWFYTLFIFDTLGDAVGFGGAYWVLIVVPMMPVVLYVLYRLYMNMLRLSSKSGASTEHRFQSDSSVMTQQESGLGVGSADVANIMRDDFVEL